MARILCVEDEEDLRHDIAEELEDSGHEILEAANGKEALDIILKDAPDMVVSDITMPVMDGYQLVQHLRKDHPKFAEMPFIFLSALADREHIIKGMGAGSDDYLTKPIDFEMLQVKVEGRLRQAERMINKKKEEQVLLYRAMKKKFADQPREESQPLQRPDPDTKIVVVGSQCEALEAFQEYMQSENYNVCAYSSGRTFLRKIKNLQPDITCLSLRTDDYDITQMLERCRNDGGELTLVIPNSAVKNLKFMLKKDQRDLLKSIIVMPTKKEEILNTLAGLVLNE